MRCLRKNMSPVWYADITGKEPIRNEDGFVTGEYRITHSNPVPFRANVSAGSGSIHTQLFGVNWTFDRVLIVEKSDFPIKDTSVLWIDKNPNDGAYDYVVKRISRGLNQTTVGVSKVSVNE